MGGPGAVDWDDPKIKEKIAKQNEALTVKCACPDCDKPFGHEPSIKPAVETAEKASA